MKKRLSFILCVFSGMLCGLAFTVLTRLFIQNLASLANAVTKHTNVSLETAAHISDVLSQFRYAEIASPFLPAILAGALSALFLKFAVRSAILRMILGILLSVMIFLGALWFTEINQIQLGAFISLLRTYLPHL